ncbi:chloride channel protein [Moorena sp. SIO4G3]|uniref:chloride channel protein n=1 Tax=Moorena sp. SIO4G3 TaxID=2607821 RepID=UPI00142ABF0C|nr:chloride channel protein [Moorena sp. SIO4G3]NEO80680.1 chloride channel protein [Moorena sp. SIO4G3]
MTSETAEVSSVNQRANQTEKSDRDNKPVKLTYINLILCATGIGIAGGLVATSYYFVLEQCLHFVWHWLPEFLEPYFPSWLPSWNYVWIATTIGGFFVGLSLYFLGLPGEMALVIEKVHDPGRMEPRQTPGMIVTSLISITAGGSAGPEAPLVQINGSLGSWVGVKLKLAISHIRILTFCGMSAALGAFFGAPIGGALFALEIPHRRSVEYYEAIVPAIVASIFSFSVFRFGTGLDVGGIYRFNLFDTLPALSWLNLIEGALLGVAGGLAAIVFIYIFRFTKSWIKSIEHRHILLATLGGLSIGLIAVFFPQTLFFSEEQIETVIEQGPTLGVTMLLGIALAKMFAISFTLHGGFRGGFIFPLFFIGANLGLAISIALPGIHPTIAMLCLMAAVNVAVTKTPVSSTVILSVLSDTSILPIIAIASFASFLLTTNISLLKTQRSRSQEAIPVMA